VTTVYLISIAAAGLVIALALSRARHDERALSWRFLIAPELQAGLAELEVRCRLEDAMLVAELDAAKRMSLDRKAQAERVLRAVLQFVEEAQPERLARLHALRTLAQMTAAVMVTPAMTPRAFRLPEVWLAASIGQLSQFVLVSPAERLALRLHVLGLGFQLALRSMRRAAARPQWSRFDRAVADWCSLDHAHVQVSYDAAAALPAHVTAEVHSR
jgi:hypothetical protein